MTERWFRDRVLRELRGLTSGSLTVVEGDRSWTFGDRSGTGPRATIAVSSPNLYRRVGLGGALGAAESYLRGEWVADDLVSALRVFARNLDAAGRLDGASGSLFVFDSSRPDSYSKRSTTGRTK